MESFELFFNNSMLSEIVTWTNQKIENMREAYTNRCRLTNNTNDMEVQALIGILLFLGITEFQRKYTKRLGH